MALERAKALDSFRQQVPWAQEAIFLDDPQRDRVSISDLKSFITADDEQTCSGRYSDVRPTRNRMRVASNDFEPDDEPEAEGRTSITTAEFKKIMKRSSSTMERVICRKSAASSSSSGSVPCIYECRQSPSSTRS